MLNYIIRRLLGAIPTLFIIIAVSFVLVRMAPGGPFDKERKVPAEVEARLIQQYHLDEPLPQQFLRYLGGLAQGDFGPSFKYKDFTVSELIWQGFPTSLALGLSAILACHADRHLSRHLVALRQNTWVDYMSVGTAMLGIAVPNFVIAPIMTLVFGLMLGIGCRSAAGASQSNWILPIIAWPSRRSPR
jgi:oligopeptide transport system permease protein